MFSLHYSLLYVVYKYIEKDMFVDANQNDMPDVFTVYGRSEALTLSSSCYTNDDAS